MKTLNSISKTKEFKSEGKRLPQALSTNIRTKLHMNDFVQFSSI